MDSFILLNSNGLKNHFGTLMPLTLINWVKSGASPFHYEMVHCWQHCYGKPSRRAYHNQEWAKKMIAVGLMPSDTGEPGGKQVGQKMLDYPLAKGKFVIESARLLSEKTFTLPWIDRMAVNTASTSMPALNNTLTAAMSGLDESLIAQLTASLQSLPGNALIAPPANNPKKTKVKYTCPGCAINVWGKGALAISCDDCQLTLLAVE